MIHGTPNGGINGTLSNGLIAHWSFNNGSLEDSSGNGNTLGGYIQKSADKDFQAIDAAGTGSQLGLPAPIFALTDYAPFAFSIWFEKNTYSSAMQILIGAGQQNGGGCYVKVQDGYVQIVANYLVKAVAHQNSLQAYNCLTISYDGGSTLRYKLNNEAVVENSVYITRLTELDKYFNFAIGVASNGFSYPFQSSFDEIRVYNSLS